jgi:hypothetical protein
MRPPRALGSIFGSARGWPYATSTPRGRSLSRIATAKRGAWSDILSRLLLGTPPNPQALTFAPGVVETTSEGFGQYPQKVLEFSSGEIEVDALGIGLLAVDPNALVFRPRTAEVSSPGIELTVQRALSFDPGGVEVTGEDLNFQLTRFLFFNPAGTVQAWSQGFRSFNPAVTQRKRPPLLRGGVHGSAGGNPYGSTRGPRYSRHLAAIFDQTTNNFAPISTRLLFDRVPTVLRFLTGLVRLDPINIGFRRSRTTLAPGVITVSGGVLRLTAQRTLSFTPTAVEVSSLDFGFTLAGRTLRFNEGLTELPPSTFGLSFTLRRSAFNSASVLVSGGSIRMRRRLQITLPNLAPTSRRFAPAQYSTSEVRAENGIRYRRFLASKPSKAVMQLNYEKITDFQASEFLDSYDATSGGATEVALAPLTLADADTALRAHMAAPHPDLFWAFAEPPRVRFYQNNTCDLTITLIARLVHDPDALGIRFASCERPAWEANESGGPYTCDDNLS